MAEHTLYKLKESDDYKVAKEDPDVRGWKLLDPSGKAIGKVDDLIIDKEAEKVRYLDIKLNEELRKQENHHILIPIGMARVHPQDEKIALKGVDSIVVLDCPAYAGGEITREHEKSLNEVLSRRADFPISKSEEGFYDNDYFDDSKFYGPRRASGEHRDTRGPFNVGKESS